MLESSPAAGMPPVASPKLVMMPMGARPAEARPRVTPVTESILWTPALGGAHRPPPPLFFAQQTLRAVHDHLDSVPSGLGIGLLAGRRHTCSRSGAPFLVVDSAVTLPALAHEDEPSAGLAEAARLISPGSEVVGWYRSHSRDAALTPADVEAHSQLFGDHPCVAVVITPGGDTGAVFRHSASPAWPVDALPFYEWLNQAPVNTDGSKPTVLRWRNYRAAEPVARLPERAHYPVFVPDDDADDEAPPPRAAPRVSRFGALSRPAIYVACAVGGTLLIALGAVLLNSGEASTGRSRDGGALEPLDRAAAVAVLDRRADTLALAITAFADRIRMFDARQMTCSGLSRGLQQVENWWLVYNIARKEALAPFDSLREIRDRSLYGDVRSVEGQFERSGCARP